MKDSLFEELVTLTAEKNAAKIKALLSEENPVDIAEVLARKEDLPIAKIYRLLPKTLAAEVFVEFDADMQEKLIGELSDKELSDTLSELFYDDAADIIEEMPAAVVKRILKNTDPGARNEINKLLKFSDGSAGSVMTTEFVSLKPEMTVKDALDYIRRVAPEKETVYTCYVTDKSKKLIGIVTAMALLTSPVEKTVEELMETNVISASTFDDREDVAKSLAKYDFLALPVVDSEERLVGIITVDDAIDVISEEAEEDFAKMAAITPSETPYLKTSVFTLFKSRIPWLLLMLVSATFTGLIISNFENSLARCAVLTMFIPMLMDTGGNCGAQSSVTVIRAISMGEISFKDLVKVLFKEIRVALLVGACLSAAAFAKLMAVDRLATDGVTVLVALTVALTLLVTVVSAKLIGVILPMTAKKIGLDPAVTSSPLITTLVDMLSLLVYFAIATTLLGL